MAAAMPTTGLSGHGEKRHPARLMTTMTTFIPKEKELGKQAAVEICVPGEAVEVDTVPVPRGEVKVWAKGARTAQGGRACIAPIWS